MPSVSLPTVLQGLENHVHKYHASVTDALRGFESQVCVRYLFSRPLLTYWGFGFGGGGFRAYGVWGKLSKAM